MSSSFNASANYVWSVNAVLGKGATGYVYQGINKNTGEAVAVKTFNQASRQRPDQVQIREFEVLQRVDHENIVKLLAVEEETKSRSRILVMELCTDSLFTILDDPENTYGLAEEEFLLVLKHTSDGMNHLRANHVVHRDLKPGNIMKFIAEDGRTVYKLTDFGAARELEDDQQFVSLYGTEEYLHPDLYERAVLRKEARKAFGATVDLWSIGVTLYHVATGVLPFRPYGGRRNCETMFKITTQKVSGIISGVQNTNKGPIEWSDQLPSTCRLSVGLRKHITPMLAGLMECNPNLMWSFDHFFAEVTALMQKRRMTVLYVDQCRLLTLYVNPNDKLDNFRSLIKEQTNIVPEKQRLFFNHKYFDEIVNAEMPSANYPQSSLEEPIYLVGSAVPVVAYTEQATNVFPSFIPSAPIEQDAITAKMICNIGYFIKRSIEQTELTYRLLKLFAQTINTVVVNQFLKLKSTVDNAEDKSLSATQKTKMLQSRHKTTAALLDLIFSTNPEVTEERSRMQLLVNSKQESSTTVTKQLDMVRTRLLTGYEKIVTEEQLWNQWKESASYKKDLCKCPSYASTYVRCLRHCWQQFERSRKPRAAPSVHNEPHLALERLRIEENRQKLCRVYQEKCLPVLQEAIKDLGLWLSMSQRTLNQAGALESDLSRIVEMLCVHDSTLDEANETYDRMVQGVIEMLENGHVQRSPVTSPTTDASSMKSCRSARMMIEKLKEIHQSHTETLDLLQMNNSMMNRLQEASVAMSDTFEKCKV